MVIDAATCSPADEAVIYASSLSRPASGSHSTVEQELRGVAGALSFLAERGIDFAARVASRAFLSLPEMDGLVAYFGRIRRRKKRPGERTTVLRVRATIRYLSFVIGLHSHEAWSTPEARALGSVGKVEFLAGLAARCPTPRPKDGTRRGLTAEQKDALMLALVGSASRAHASGDAGRIFTADRDALWMDAGLELGLRTGEKLGIRLCDLDLDAGTLRIVRRPDAADDPRKELARVKGEPRELDLSPYLADRIRSHVAVARAGRPGASKHGFLFVSASGNPLSRSAVNRMFARLREAAPSLGMDFCNHRIRHQWNERFSEDAVAAGLSAADEAAARAYAQGWKSEASAAAYLAHRARKQAAKVSRHSQERQMAARAATHG